MGQPSFPVPTRIADQDRLRALFGNDRLSLGEGASVTLEGAIALGADVSFHGDCVLLDGTAVEQGSILTDVQLGRSNCVRPYSVLTGLRAGDRNLFGPFCFIRDDCTVGDDCILGAHVEAARSAFASRVKVSHRAFIGDAQIGEETIIGAGVVFCNWDGEARQATRVGARVTLGSGVLLVPPVAVGDGALVAAGSTVTKDVAVGAKVIQKR